MGRKRRAKPHHCYSQVAEPRAAGCLCTSPRHSHARKHVVSISQLGKLYFRGEVNAHFPMYLLRLLLIALLLFACSPAQPQKPAPPTREPSLVAAHSLTDGELPAANQDGDFILGPTHAPAPATLPQPGVPRGTVSDFVLNSTDSKFYPGIARDAHTFGQPDPKDPAKLIVTTSHAAPYSRRVTVYVPSQYVAGTEAPFIVGADGPDPLLFATLDNLIAEHRVPAMVAISIANGGGDAQGSERGLEYDTMSGRYAEFVEQKCFP